MTEQTRTCPACSSANPPIRELCAACGAGLDDGVVPPAPAAADETPDPPSPPVVRRRRRRHRRWLVPLLGGLALGVLLVLALTLAGLGPFASGPDVPAADLEPADYPGDPGPLTMTDIATRSAAADADAEAAVAIADGNPETAWRSSGELPEGVDVLDTIDLVLEDPSWVTAIELANGDQADRDAYDASSPLREVQLSFDGGTVVVAELLDIGLQRQAVTLPEPTLTTVIRVDVLQRVAGPHDELAVSELTPVGWPARGDDVEIAARRAEAEPATGSAGPDLPLGSRSWLLR